MDEYTQLLFMQWLAALTGAETEEELLEVMQQMGLEGLQQAYALFLQDPEVQKVLMAQLSLAQYGKLGTKINYISRLRGNCPIGYEMRYYKAGGRVCKKCVRKHLLGKEIQKGVMTGADAVKDFIGDFDDKYNNSLSQYISSLLPIISPIARAGLQAGKYVGNMLDDETKQNIFNDLKALVGTAGVAGLGAKSLMGLFDKYRKSSLPKANEANAY